MIDCILTIAKSILEIFNNIPADVKNIAYNIIGGILAGLSIIAFQKIKRKLRHRSFKRIFGNDLEENFYLIYPAYEAPQGASFSKPQPRVTRRTSATINLTTVNSTAASRSISHLASAIGRNSKSPSIIRSDVEVDEMMDISFISIGGLNNHKTIDILDSPLNSFITFDNNVNIVSATTGNTIIQAQSNVDYGIIIKINPSHNPDRTWLCCAGIGQWGTSGAAWWLNKHWKIISRQAKKRPFAIVTQTQVGSDDSTQMLHLFLSEEDI
jgi:hypothetical protein